MKKKFIVLLTIAALCITMTGCAFELPFKKDKVDEAEGAPSTDIEDDLGSTGIEPRDGATFSIGDTITVYDLVMIPDNIGEPSSIWLKDQSGIEGESITLAEVGDWMCEVSIDFPDGNSWGGVVQYSVVEGSEVSFDNDMDTNAAQSSDVPDSIVNSINNESWSSFFLPTTNIEDSEMKIIDSSVVISSSDNGVTLTLPYGILRNTTSITYGLDSDGSYIIPIGYLDSGLEGRLDELKESPLKQNTIAKYVLSELFTNDDFTVSYDGVDLTLEESNQIYEWYAQAIDNICSVRTGNTGYELYDAEGKSYPINVVICKADFGSLGLTGQNTVECATFYYVEYTGGYIVFGVPIESDMSPVEQNEESHKPENYEDVCNEIISSKAMMNLIVRDNTADAERYVSTLSNMLLIGDYSNLIKSNVIDEENSIQVDGSGESGDDEDKLKDTAGKVITFYEKRYPDLYTYNWNPGANVYRRYVYNITDKTTYLGCIIPRNTNNSIQIGGGTVNVPDNYDEQPALSSNSDIYGNSNNSSTEFTLKSSFSSYIVDSTNMPSVTFDTAVSTMNKLALVNNGSRYYIELGRASMLNNYLTQCIYPVNQMTQIGEYNINKSDASSISLSLGTLDLYTVSYMDQAGDQVDVPYMSVFTIGSDYIVCYADSLNSHTTGSELMDMLSKMIRLE